jgi:hypothetical protein
MIKNYINLSAGLLQNKYEGEIIRIQSSHLESHAFDRLFYSLSDSLLYNLAVGNCCRIIDCSSNSIGKVIKTFIPMCKMVLSKRWKLPYNESFDAEYAYRIRNSLSRHTIRKLDYYRKFNPKKVDLIGVSIRVQREIVNFEELV